MKTDKHQPTIDSVDRKAILAQLLRDRLIIGDIGMIYCKSAINGAPLIDPMKVLGIGYCKDCDYASVFELEPCMCGLWVHEVDAHHFCSRFERRKV